MQTTPDPNTGEASPKPPPEGSSATRKALLLALTAGLLFFSTGAAPIALAAWLVNVFALRFGRTSKALTGYLALALVSMPAIAWAWSLFPFGGAFGLIILAVFAGFTSALPVLFDRLVSTRLRGFARTLPFPVAVTALDFLLGSSPDFGSWGATGYSQIDSLALMQLVSITGLLGLTFLTAWFAAAVNAIWETGGDLREGWLPAAPAFALITLTLAWGQGRLAFAPVASDTIQVTAIGGPRMQIFPTAELRARWEQGELLDAADLETLRQHNARSREATLAAAEEAAEGGSALLTWGEGAVVVLDEDAEALSESLSALARKHQATLLASVITLPTGEGERRWDNQAWLIGPDGEMRWAYRKTVPTPGRERAVSLRGDGKLLSSEIDGTRLAALICYDLDFPDLAAQAGEQGVDVLVGPSGDWPEVALMHAKMARSRAIEQGVVLVRPTTGGISVIYDGLGRVLAWSPTTDEAVHSVTTRVPARRRSTLYAMFSGTFGWLSVLALLSLMGLRISKRKSPQWQAKTDQAS